MNFRGTLNLKNQHFLWLVISFLMVSAYLLLFYGFLKPEVNNKNELISPIKTAHPTFTPLTKEGWGRRVVSSSNKIEVDQELISIWENSRYIKVASSDAKIINSTTSVCLIKSRGIANINSTDWKISSKRDALEKVAKLIAFSQQNSTISKAGFIDGKIIALRFNEADKSVDLSFEARLSCS